MKARITHLKAPWPLGAVAGDVVEFQAVPAWAVGKFQEVGEDEPVTLVFGDPVLVELKRGDSSEVEGLNATIAELKAKLEAADAAAADQAEALAVARAALTSADSTISDLGNENAELKAKLEAAQAKTGKK